MINQHGHNSPKFICFVFNMMTHLIRQHDGVLLLVVTYKTRCLHLEHKCKHIYITMINYKIIINIPRHYSFFPKHTSTLISHIITFIHGFYPIYQINTPIQEHIVSQQKITRNQPNLMNKNKYKAACPSLENHAITNAGHQLWLVWSYCVQRHQNKVQIFQRIEK